jgi:DegV family protein with EDD domain
MKTVIVTDSVADIPENVAEEWNIAVIPLYVIFGRESYQDGIEMSKDQFYERLVLDPQHPKTSAPSPADFLKTWQKLISEGTEKIINISVGSKLSGTYNSALRAREIMPEKDIEVIDSTYGGMAQGLLVIAAAKMAKAGKKADEITAEVKRSIHNIRFLIIIDVLEYAVKGGRLNANLAKVFQPLVQRGLRPLLTIKEGKVDRYPPYLVKASNRKEKILNFIKGFRNVEAIALEYSPEATGEIKKTAQELEQRIKRLYCKTPFYVSTITPVIGVHAGPGALIVGLLV